MTGDVAHAAGRELTTADVDALSRAAQLRLGEYRAPHVAEQVRRALAREPVADVPGLAALVRRDAGARVRFRRAIANSASGLFRDPQQFELLETELLPRLLADTAELRVWSVGAADGRELYSVGVVLERLGRLDGAHLLGSDVLAENVEAARRAEYADFAPGPALRAAVRWEQRDVLAAPPPPGPWQLVLCRNLAIYLSRGARDALYAGLAGALAPGGVLLLGRSERILTPQALALERAGPSAYRRAA